MSGPISYDALPLLYNTVRPDILTSPDRIVNLAQERTHPFFVLLRSKKKDEMDRPGGGPYITETIKSDNIGGSGAYNPRQQAQIKDSNSSVILNYPWRLYRNPVTWTEFEYNAYTNGSDITRAKNFIKFKEIDRVSEHWKMLNNLVFQVPNYAKMEAAATGNSGQDVGEMYSLPAFIREDTTRWLPPATDASGASAWGTATLFGQTGVTTKTWLQNKVATFAPGTPFDSTNGIVAAFDRMLPELVYQEVPDANAGDEPPGGTSLVTFTNKNGVNLMQQASRAANDYWQNSDLYRSAVYKGMDIIYVAQLDSALLDQTRGASAAYTGQPYPDGYPRYFVVNTKHTYPVFMAGQMAKRGPVITNNPNQPDVSVVWTNTSGNIVTNAPNRNGIICPIL